MCMHSAQIECVQLYGIPEGEEYDIFRSPDVDAACTRVMKIAQTIGEMYVDNLSIELIQFLGGKDEKKK